MFLSQLELSLITLCIISITKRLAFADLDILFQQPTVICEGKCALWLYMYVHRLTI